MKNQMPPPWRDLLHRAKWINYELVDAYLLLKDLFQDFMLKKGNFFLLIF